MKIVVSGGGTGGHTLPTLAVINKIRIISSDAKITFIGSRFGMESKLIPKLGIKYYGISAGKFRRYHASKILNFIDPATFFKNFFDFFRFIKGIFEAREVLEYEKPNVIFAKGGYVSLPVGLAARMLKIPVVIHESDIVMGLANRKMSSFAAKVCVTFPENNYPDIPLEKIVYTGSPVREDVLGGNKDRFLTEIGFSKDRKTILVMGGSQGSRMINDMISDILEIILRDYQLIWVTGERDAEIINLKLQEVDANLKKNLKTYSFVTHELADIYASTDLFIGRSGSNVIFELATYKIPSIFIPLASSAGGHQFENARVISRNGGAYIFKEETVTSKRLLHQINYLFENKEELSVMSEKIGKWSSKDSAEKIAKIVLETGEKRLEEIRQNRKK